MLHLAELHDHLERRLEAASAEVRPAEATTEEEVATEARRLVTEIVTRTKRHADFADWVRKAIDKLVEDDSFDDEEDVANMTKLAARMRGAAPEIAKLRLPETDPPSMLFQKWVRPYNDAVTSLTRVLLDAAHTIETRLRDDVEEDEEARAFVASGGLERLRARD